MKLSSLKSLAISQWLVMLVAILLPFVIIRSFPKFFHGSDVDDFFRWSQAWVVDWQSIYINCERCNYPLLGTFLSGGIMSTIHIENFRHLATRFRYYLAVFDALNIIAMWFILNKLQVKNAPLWAGVIGLLPSSWLGSSVWGQIDGIGQLLLLSFFIVLIVSNEKEREFRKRSYFMVVLGFLFGGMILTKQLIYFSLLALGVILVLNVVLASRNLKEFGASILALGLSAIFPVAIADLVLNLPDSYFSHLQYILATGSKHGDTISYLGMNIWNYFTDDLLGSSHQAISIHVGSVELFSLVPYSTGTVLFIVTFFVLTWVFSRYIFHLRSKGVNQFDKNTILFFLLFLALVNLSFNLTMTGVHERYLYHFYPFVIIACLGWTGHTKYFNIFTIALLLIGSVVYGAYLYGYLTLLIRPLTGQLFMRGMTTINLFLFFYLAYISWKEIKDQIAVRNLSS